MKKILTTAILCAGLVGFTACDSFLDEDPKSSLTLDTYYKTSADIIGNVNYLYRDGAPDKMGNMTGALNPIGYGNMLINKLRIVGEEHSSERYPPYRQYH